MPICSWHGGFSVNRNVRYDPQHIVDAEQETTTAIME